VRRASVILNSPIAPPRLASDCRFLWAVFLSGGISSRHVMLPAPDLARAAWGEAEAPWHVPDGGQVRPMNHGTITSQSVDAQPADMSTMVASMGVPPGCEPIP
jgi:hypothetical protein